jgi:hypothetical protein
VFIYDFTGKLIYKENFSGLNTDIFLSAISNGIYFINIEDKNGKVFRQKLIKN